MNAILAGVYALVFMREMIAVAFASVKNRPGDQGPGRRFGGKAVKKVPMYRICCDTLSAL